MSDEAVVEAVKPEAAAASDLAVSATASSDWEANASLEKMVEKSRNRTDGGWKLLSSRPRHGCWLRLVRSHSRCQGTSPASRAMPLCTLPKSKSCEFSCSRGCLLSTPQCNVSPTKSRKGKKVARPLGRTFLEQKAKREVKQLERARQQFVEAADGGVEVIQEASL